jgi:hypothetical protein
MIIDYGAGVNGLFLEDIQDVLHIGLNDNNIANIESDEKDYEKALKEIKDYCQDIGDEKIIIAVADIKTKDFPEEEYTLSVSKDCNKKLIPIDEVLKKIGKLYENAGFVNVNEYVGYEYQTAFVYPNEYGKEIIQKFNAIIKADNEKQVKEIIQGLNDVIDSLNEQLDTDIELD